MTKKQLEEALRLSQKINEQQHEELDIKSDRILELNYQQQAIREGNKVIIDDDRLKELERIEKDYSTLLIRHHEWERDLREHKTYVAKLIDTAYAMAKLID